MSKFMSETIITGANVAVDATSSVIDFKLSYGYAVTATFTGAPTGTVLIQGSIDQTNWATISTLTISGTVPQHDNKDAVYWPFIRAHKAAGGTGTVTVSVTTKGA